MRVLSGGCPRAALAGGGPPAGDAGFADWALKSLTPPPMWPRTLLDLTFAHPYIPSLGFAVSVDGAARLGRALPAIALTSVFPPGSFYQDHPVSDDVKVPRSPHPCMSLRPSNADVSDRDDRARGQCMGGMRYHGANPLRRLGHAADPSGDTSSDVARCALQHGTRPVPIV